MRKSVFKYGIATLLVPVVMMSCLTACTYNQNRAQPAVPPSGSTMHPTSQINQSAGNVKSIDNPYVHNYSGRYDGTRPNVYTESDVKSAQQITARVSGIARHIPGVNRVVAVAQGIDIVIGIEGTGDRKALEEKVKYAVKQKEPGYNIFVTSNPDLNNHIRMLFTSMNNVRTTQVTPGISVIIYEIGRLSSK